MTLDFFRGLASPAKLLTDNAITNASGALERTELAEAVTPHYTGPATTLLLSGGFYALIDLADHADAAAHRWSHHTNGTQHYAVREERGVRIYLHRFLMQAPAGFHVDHINGDGLDCRRANMRLCTNAQNSMNRAPRKGQFKGVGLRESGKWRAQLRTNGRTIYVGLFDTPEEAAAAYDRRAVELFGEFARLNFPAGGAA